MILDEILENRKRDVERRREELPEAALAKALEKRSGVREFRAAISGEKNRVKLICEMKKASPSAGVIKEDYDPVKTARAYEAGGADALSVLTEEKYFLGRIEDISAIREAGIALPILRKDFVCDLYQVVEAAAFGADAVLLIVGVMAKEETQTAIRACEDYRMTAVVEVNTEDELKEALDLGAGIVQINNRDLRSFRVDLSTTERLLPSIPKGKIVISASGFKTPEEVRRVRKLGVDAVLIGESLMRHADPARFIKELVSPAP